jgi:hypothetical protein
MERLLMQVTPVTKRRKVFILYKSSLNAHTSCCVDNVRPTGLFEELFQSLEKQKVNFPIPGKP